MKSDKEISVLAQSCYMTKYGGEGFSANAMQLFRKTEPKNT